MFSNDEKKDKIPVQLFNNNLHQGSFVVVNGLCLWDIVEFLFSGF